jgi:hypothetical protein
MDDTPACIVIAVISKAALQIFIELIQFGDPVIDYMRNINIRESAVI